MNAVIIPENPSDELKILMEDLAREQRMLEALAVPIDVNLRQEWGMDWHRQGKHLIKVRRASMVRIAAIKTAMLMAGAEPR